MADPQLSIEIISDVICPWCYIGKRRLERALEFAPGIDPVISWKPYLLEPQIPYEGMDRQEYIDTKYGKEESVGIFEAIKEVGSEVGIQFAFEQIERMPLSFDAHRLIQWAESEGCQDEVVENLFVSHFVEGGDISDLDLLGDLAALSGMDADQIRLWLDSEQDVNTLNNDIKKVVELGIKAIPTLVINRMVLMTGIEAPELLAQAFIKIADSTTSRF